MKAEQRLWWTADRARLVPETDPAATYLAYPVGHDIAAEHQPLLAPAPDPAEPETKPVEQQPNKQRRPQAKK